MVVFLFLLFVACLVCFSLLDLSTLGSTYDLKLKVK